MFKDKFKYKNKGFTLIELLMVIAIAIILAASAWPIYSGLQNSSHLNSAAAQTAQNIRFAQEKSRAAENDSAHGIYFEENSGAPDKLVIYQGGSYLTRDQAFDREYIFDSSLEMVSDIAGSDLNFFKGTGRSAQAGDIIITGQSSSRFIIISINSLGMVEVVY